MGDVSTSVGDESTKDGWRPTPASASLIRVARPDARTPQPYRIAIAVVTLLGLYHGAVPLVVRGLFGADQRFAPALWLSAPWWWLACLAVTALAIGLVVGLDTAGQRHLPATRPPEAGSPGTDQDTSNDVEADAGSPGAGANGYDALSGVVFLVGLYNGVAPLVARLLFDTNLLLALPLRLAAPWWWLTSLAVVAATILLLAAIDHAKQRR